MALDINYTPPPTGAKFMESDAKMRVLMGPVGSGKSVTCSFEVVRRASLQAPNAQGHPQDAGGYCARNGTAVAGYDDQNLPRLVPTGGLRGVHAYNQDLFLQSGRG